MFLFHVAFSLGLISLTVGTALYVWSSRMPYSGFGKFIGFLVIVFSLLTTACVGYSAVQFWRHDPMRMMMQDMEKPGMMNQEMAPKAAPQPKKR